MTATPGPPPDSPSPPAPRPVAGEPTGTPTPPGPIVTPTPPEPIATPAPPEPVVTRRRRFLPSLIWLIPLVAAIIGVSIVVRMLAEQGPSIVITFRSAEGLEAGRTRLKYKDVDIGVVRSITLAPDRSHVRVAVQLQKDAASFAAADTRFWVVRPRADFSGVSGLGTLLSGAYIGVDAGADPRMVTSFTGLEVPPTVTRDTSGRQFTLHAKALGSLDIGAPVYFRGVKVGQVAAYALDADGRGVTLRAFVRSPFDRFVGANTRFWHSSGLDMQLDASGFRLRTQSLATVVLGGIAFHAPDDRIGPPAAENTAFQLAADEGAAMARSDGPAEPMLMYFNQSLRGLAPGAPVDFRGVVIGEVKSIGIEFDSREREFRMPVLVQIYPDRLGPQPADAGAEPGGDVRRRRLLSMISRGMRAQLRQGNLLTGQLYVAVDFFPNAKAPETGLSVDPPEMPTIPGSLDELQAQIGEIAGKLNRVPFEAIGAELRKTVATLNRTLAGAEGTVKALNEDVAPDIRAAMKDVRDTLIAVQKTLAGTRPLQDDLRQSLREVGRAAGSLRVLTDYLERHPESLLRGKPKDPP